MLKPVIRRLVPFGQSGRRDLNPQPPAWKAGALPLSYTRTPTDDAGRTHEDVGLSGEACQALLPIASPAERRLTGRKSQVFTVASIAVGREGFEPPKAIGRQIYSLVQLTALPPALPITLGHRNPIPDQGASPTHRRDVLIYRF